MLSNKAIYELSVLADEADKLSRGNAADRTQSTVLVQRMKMIRETGISSEEARSRYVAELHQRLNGPEVEFETRYRRAFRNYMFKNDDTELRQILVGAPVGTVGYTTGQQGGYLVPIDFENEVIEGMSQWTDLLDPEKVNLKFSGGSKLRPGQISGYDLSTITAGIVGEDAQQTASTFPAVSGAVMKPSIMFKVTFVASLEAEMDIDDFYAKTARAAGIAFGRAIGTNIISSSSFTNALAQAITTPVVTTSTGVISLTNILAIYFGLNRIYRNSPKAAWVCSDSVYQRLRQSVDNQSRPLIDINKDKEELMGKPIYISPDLGNLASGNSTLYFGDLSHLIVRMNKVMFSRETQNLSTMDITMGNCGYVFRTNADCIVHDPTSGNTPPIISATITK